IGDLQDYLRDTRPDLSDALYSRPIAYEVTRERLEKEIRDEQRAQRAGSTQTESRDDSYAAMQHKLTNAYTTQKIDQLPIEVQRLKIQEIAITEAFREDLLRRPKLETLSERKAVQDFVQTHVGRIDRQLSARSETAYGTPYSLGDD